MAKWDILLSEDAEDALREVTKSTQDSVAERLEWFAESFDSLTPIPLHADWRGYYKLRAGDYRIAYKINYERHLLLIEHIQHRSRAYKRKRK